MFLRQAFRKRVSTAHAIRTEERSLISIYKTKIEIFLVGI